MKVTFRRFSKVQREALFITIIFILLLVYNRIDNPKISEPRAGVVGPSLYDLNQRSADVGFSNDHKKYWNLSEEQIDSLYFKWKAAVASADKSPGFKLSRGVIYSVFPDNLQSAIKSINILRHLGCNLPIHVCHYAELDDEHVSKFLKLVNVSVIDTKQKLKSMGVTLPRIEGKQFHLKSAAIIYSEFKEILFIDSDNIPISDPTFLFSDPNYISTGTIFWKGRRVKLTLRPLENPPRQPNP